MNYEDTQARCPCCYVSLQINVREFGQSYLSYPDSFAYLDYDYDPFDYRDEYEEEDERYDPYADELAYQDEIDAEWEARELEALELTQAESAAICFGGSKSRRHARFERCKERKDKLNHKRPAAQRSLSEAVMQKRMDKWRRDFRFAIEDQHNRYPKHTKQGD